MIENCAICLYFVSQASVRSSVCEREVSLAVRRDRKVLPVYIEDTALSPTLELGIGNLQAIRRVSGSSTGTPSGVGSARQPPVFLVPGDRVELSIDRLGSQGQRVIEPR